MRMSAKELRDFETTWREYEVTLTRVLPRCLVQLDPETGQEITHLVSCRDTIEGDLERFAEEPKLLPYRAKLPFLDAELLHRRDAILAHVPLNTYRRQRRRSGLPESHWWRYLDRVDRAGDKAAPRAVAASAVAAT